MVYRPLTDLFAVQGQYFYLARKIFHGKSGLSYYRLSKYVLWPGKGSSSVANEPWKEVRDKTLKRGNVNVLISKPGPVRWKCKQDRVSVLGLFWTICWGSCHGLCSKTARRQTEAGLIPMNLLRTSSKGHRLLQLFGPTLHQQSRSILSAPACILNPSIGTDNDCTPPREIPWCKPRPAKQSTGGTTRCSRELLTCPCRAVLAVLIILEREHVESILPRPKRQSWGLPCLPK